MAARADLLQRRAQALGTVAGWVPACSAVISLGKSMATARRLYRSARETAAGERLNDTQSIRNRQEERDHAAEAYPDGVPDDRELRRRCRQLRDAGRDLPACR